MKLLPTDYQSFIAISRYSRWIDEKGRREYWNETVDRYVDNVIVPYIEDKQTVREIREAILNLEVMPSMRGLMTAGPALNRDNTCLFNPVRGNSLVQTKEFGLIPISEVGEKATVLNKDGRWAPADFTCYGNQDIWAVHLNLNSNTRKTVECTPNHRWVLLDGTVKSTKELIKGDKIGFASAPKPDSDNIDYRLGVIHGLVFGDGTTTYSQKRVMGYLIRLCSDAEDLLPYFDKYPRTYPKTCDGDPVVYLYDDFAKTHQLKELPDENETLEYLLGFIRGWFAADGYISKNKQVSIAVNAENLDWFLKNSGRVGFVAQSISEYPQNTNYGERNTRLYRVTISRSSLCPEDFLIKRKRERFCPLESVFYVSFVEDLGIKDTVYCAEVPDTNTFVLDQGLVTGNCTYLPIDDPKCFDEALFILACGAGVGFSVERQYINKLPEVPEKLYESDTTVVVKDSREGWAKALRQIIAILYSGEIPKWDVSKVRPAGSRLKTFGGRSSGSGPLIDLFKFVVNIFKNAAGRKLNSLECHDIMCKIGEVIVAGAARRSAMISLSNLSDDRMRNAKNGQWWELNPQRTLSNNSVAYTEKPDIETFLREWLTLVESKSGERGIFNRIAAQKQAEKTGRREITHEFGTNPCLHPDSLVETIHGRVKIKDITHPTYVYSMDSNGKLVIRPCSASWISKKDAETINITIASGKVVRCTPDHRIYIEGKGWIEAREISIGDRVVHLVRNRRGAAYSGVKLTTQDKLDFIMEHRLIWESVNGPIPDGYDIHHIDGDTYNNDIDNLECLTHSDHASITRHESENNHQIMGYRDSNPGNMGSMWGFISTGERKKKKITPMPEELKSNLHQYATVVKIEQGEITDVYDLTVEDTHNFIADFVVVHNCSEIVLRPFQMCNLSSVVARSGDTLEDLARKIKLATIIGTVQSCYTKFPYLRKIWRKNCEEERLLGVSITGALDCDVTSPKNKNVAEVFEKLKEEAIETNKIWANILGIEPSTSITCVKPEGTSSQVNNSSSGIHSRYSPYYIRTVRADIKDPLTRFMIDQGVPNEPCVIRGDSTVVFSFPIKSPENSIFRDDMTAIEQLEYWLTVQRHYCEHKPSVTIYVKDHEWLEVGAFVYKNFDEISGVSFLPHTDHVYQQAPYQEITKEQYEEALSKMPTSIDWEKLSEYEEEDNTKGSQTLNCTGGVCEIVDLT
jgi:ribonucleotide reductase alpha subunit